MKLSYYLQSMYVWTIALLLLMAGLASYNRGLPAGLVAAITVAVIADLSIKKLVLKRKLTPPLSAIISGTIIGSIAPFNAPILAVVLASAAAILSKYAIRLKGMHVFNPATFGLLVSLSIFSLGDEWWAAGASFSIFGIAMTLTFLLILASYKSMKLGASLSFLITISILSYFTGIIPLNSLSTPDIVRFLDGLPYYFAFIMVAEPRTSPYARREQIAFGIGVAVLSVFLPPYIKFYSLFVALLIGNLAYALYRIRNR